MDAYQIATQTYNLCLSTVVGFLRDDANRTVVAKLAELLRALDAAAARVKNAAVDLPNDKATTANGITTTAGKRNTKVQIDRIPVEYYKLPGVVKAVDVAVLKDLASAHPELHKILEEAVYIERSKGTTKLPVANIGDDILELLGIQPVSA